MPLLFTVSSLNHYPCRWPEESRSNCCTSLPSQNCTPKETHARSSAHQLSAVINLSVLFEQQSCGPLGSNAWHLLFELRPIENRAVGHGGITVSFRTSDLNGTTMPLALSPQLSHCPIQSGPPIGGPAPGWPVRARAGRPASPSACSASIPAATKPAASLRRRLITLTVLPRRASWCAIARPISPPPRIRWGVDRFVSLQALRCSRFQGRRFGHLLSIGSLRQTHCRDGRSKSPPGKP